MEMRRFDELIRRVTAGGPSRRAVLTGLGGATLAGGLALVSRAGVGAKPSPEKQCRKDVKAACKAACKSDTPPDEFADLNQGQCIKACTAAGVAEQCGTDNGG
jgi:hypothetical protein